MTAPSPLWSEVPRRPPSADGLDRALVTRPGPGDTRTGAASAVDERVRSARAVVAALAPALPVAAYTAAVADRSDAALVLGVVTAASAAGGAIDDRRWLLRPPIWALAGLGAWALGVGRLPALWTMVLLGLADWAIRGRRPVPPIPARPVGLLPATLATALLTVPTHTTHDPPDFLTLTAIGGIATLAWALWAPALRRLAGGARHGVVATAAGVSFWAIGLLVVALPWLAHRLVGLDPLAAHPPGWNRRGRPDVRPAHRWSPDPLLDRPPLHHRVRAAAAVPITIVLAVLGTLIASPSGPADRPGSNPHPRPAAAADADWWERLDAEYSFAISRVHLGGNPYATGPYADFDGRHVTISDGFRTTWSPPPCSCRRLTVWMYGGSTVVGWGQRDDHTIASRLARLAWSEGIALDVSNRGVQGEFNWEESNRFVHDLATGTPDLVVFYDGSNDTLLSDQRNEDRSVGYSPRLSTRWVGPDTRESNWFRERLFGGEPTAPPLAVPPYLGVGDLATAIAGNWDDGRLPAVAATTVRSVAAAWFWQPDVWTRTPQRDALDPTLAPPESSGRLRELHERIATLLPPDVHDLSDAVDDLPGPVYYDVVHMNEDGASAVATDMFDVLRPTFEQLIDADQATNGH